MGMSGSNKIYATAAYLNAHYLPGTDVTVLGQMVCKSPYTPLGMQIHYRCFVTVIPAVSNDNTLTLTRSIEFT